jgi:hypothetical protein
VFNRRRGGRPPPIAEAGDDTPIALEVRVQPGTEEGALKELRALGAEGDVAGRGELRIKPGGPLRPVLAAESALAFYAVHHLAGAELREVGDEALMRAALGLAGIVANLQRGKLRSYRVTAGTDLGEEQKVVNQLSQRLGSRLGIPRTIVQPELVLIVRPAPGGFELAARLPKAGERPALRPPIPTPVAPRRRTTPRPRRAGPR